LAETRSKETTAHKETSSEKDVPAHKGKHKGGPIVIDATGLILGRASSLIAKRLLSGEHIMVVNAEKALILGSRDVVIKSYTEKVARGSVRKGPHFPRGPDRIFRRTVRGMLPYKRSTGREAYGRLMAYVGVPEDLKGKTPETLDGARAIPALREPMTLLEISRLLGSKV
jgi:large subunit ribosomal protein L13